MKPVDSPVTSRALSAHGIVRRVGEGGGQRLLLDDVSLDLHAGEAVALVGPSGAGKTTLLNVLAGLDLADAGTLTVAGETIRGSDRAALDRYRRERVGVVFQFYNLIASLTALENVLAGAEAAGQRPDEARGRALLADLGLAGREASFPSRLSGGEQQRVAIARALIKRPAVLLGDEPTGNLDARTGDCVTEELIEHTRSSGAALLVVTHNEKLAARFDRVLEMVDGRLSERGGMA